jgi:hypothetical protein
MLLGNPDLIHKGVRVDFKVARFLHLLGRLAFAAAEHLMPMLILERPVCRVCHLMPAMNLAPFLHRYPPVIPEGLMR